MTDTSIRTKPFMPPTREALAAENHLSVRRSLFAYVLGHIQRKSADSIVRENWPGDATAAILTRAATTQITTINSGLPMLTAVKLLPGIQPKGAASQVLAQAGLKLDFAGKQQFSLPLPGTLPDDPTIFWIGEAGAFPVLQGLISGLTIGPPSKLGFMVAFTNELAEYAIEDGFKLFSRLMTETSRIKLDKVLFSTAAATSKSQAGLLNGVAVLPATTGGGLAALVGDLKKLAGAMATAGVSSDGAVMSRIPNRRKL